MICATHAAWVEPLLSQISFEKRPQTQVIVNDQYSWRSHTPRPVDADPGCPAQRLWA
jgi:hypothetical protein